MQRSEYLELCIICICGVFFICFAIILFMHLKACIIERKDANKVFPDISENQDTTTMLVSQSPSSHSYRMIEVEAPEAPEAVSDSGCFTRNSKKTANGISLRKK